MLRGRLPALSNMTMPTGRMGTSQLLPGLLSAGGPALEQLKREAGWLLLFACLSDVQTHRGLQFLHFRHLVQSHDGPAAPSEYINALQTIAFNDQDA